MSEKGPSHFTPEEEKQIKRLVALEEKGSRVTPKELEERKALRKKMTLAQLSKVTQLRTGRK